MYNELDISRKPLSKPESEQLIGGRNGRYVAHIT